MRSIDFIIIFSIYYEINAVKIIIVNYLNYNSKEMKGS